MEYLLTTVFYFLENALFKDRDWPLIDEKAMQNERTGMKESM